MLPSSARLAGLSQLIQKSLPKALPGLLTPSNSASVIPLPPSLQNKPANLYQILSRKPNVNSRLVHQTRWTQKGIDNCWWQVTRAELKCDGNHGKVWGYKWWRGKKVSRIPEEISGGLKYRWLDGPSGKTKKRVPPPPPPASNAKPSATV